MHGLDRAIRSRRVEGVNGLSMHCLEAGEPGRLCVLLLHGFPELAYSWRKVIAPIAAAGFYVVAPDQRGYGETTGWDGRYEADLASFRMLNLVQDCVSLLSRLKIGSHCILQLLAAGHQVRTTVRSPQREADVRAMLKEGGAEPGDRLSFAVADLEADAGWPQAVAGCDYVLHVASPFPRGRPPSTRTS